VAAIGLSAVNAASVATQEGGMDETLVKIEFDERTVRLPPNSRVNVWVRNPAAFWS
jgi:hypothetical protein